MPEQGGSELEMEGQGKEGRTKEGTTTGTNFCKSHIELTAVEAS